MKDYIIVYAQYLDEFEKRVNEKLDAGYIPVGGVFIHVSTDMYCQAMAKPK